MTMKRVAFLLAAATCPQISSAAEASESAALSAEQGVRAFEAQVFDAYNRGDHDAAAAHYAEDAFVYIPGQPPTHGRAAIAANIKRFMADPNFKLGYEKGAIHVSAAGDFAYTRGKLMVSYTDPKTKAARTTTSNFLLLLHKRPGAGWQVVEDISF